MNLNDIVKKLQPFRIPLLILILGLILLLMPGGKSQNAAQSADAQLCETLSAAEGVGEARVLISEHGVLVVCEGGDSAAVKLDIIRAVGSYTGFGSDRITILKMLDR